MNREDPSNSNQGPTKSPEDLEQKLEKTQYVGMEAGASMDPSRPGAHVFATYQPRKSAPEDRYFKKNDKVGHNFTVLELLGEGASGTVYRVRNNIGGIEALKIAPPDLLGTSESRNSFLRELRAARSLHHDHLIPIHNVETLPENDQVFFTMKYMAGKDLGYHLEKTPAGLPPERVLTWMMQVAQALSYVHSKGLVHQDIKPANILLDKNGAAHLGDFGLAFKYMTDTLKQRLSRTSKAGGTSYFMSPEQNQAVFFGKNLPITAASDVCSFALTFYTLITQKMLIGRPASMKKYLANMHMAEALDGFLEKCWEEDPGDRFPNAMVMQTALNKILTTQPIPKQEKVKKPHQEPEPLIVHPTPGQFTSISVPNRLPLQEQPAKPLLPQQSATRPYGPPAKKPLGRRLLIWTTGIVVWATLMLAGYALFPLLREEWNAWNPPGSTEDPYAPPSAADPLLPPEIIKINNEFQLVTKGDGNTETTVVFEKNGTGKGSEIKEESSDTATMQKARTAYQKGNLETLQMLATDLTNPDDISEIIRLISDLEDKKETQIQNRYEAARKKNDLSAMKKALAEWNAIWPNTTGGSAWEAEIASLELDTTSLDTALGYYFGTGGTFDEEKAKAFFLKAEKTRDPLALMWVARMYNTAMCTFPFDSAKAAKLAKDAIGGVITRAKNGNPMAQFLLAECYFSGLGVETNQNAYLDWHTKAAAKGFVGSQVNLGALYRNGSFFPVVDINSTKAYKLFMDAAAQGEVRSLFFLGQMYLTGEGTVKNETYAATSMEKAAEKGYTQAQADIGKMYDLGIGVKQDPKQAEKWYRKAALKGHPDAQLGLGNILFFGYGTPRNDSEAFKWYKAAADQGHGNAQCSLAHMYRMGYGTAKNLQEAARLYKLAAEKGIQEAYYVYARMLYYGEGINENKAEAFVWFENAAKLGDMEAQFMAGLMRVNGQGVSINYQDAMYWFKAAEAQGHLVAQNNIGYLYGNGLGVDKDNAMAARYYYAAAASGEKLGQYNIALKYQLGEGVDQNSYEAFKWYKAAADQNMPQAQYRLGLMHLNGEATPMDRSTGLYYLRLAANQNDKNAQDKLIELGEGWYDDGGKGK